MIKASVLTNTEQEVISKRLNNEPLTKQDSYYLTTSIRPKLRQMEELIKNNTLQKIEYNQKIASIEKKITNIILKEIKDVKAIILYGSAIQTNYSKYNDIDLLVLTKDKICENKWKKMDLLIKLKDKAKEIGLNLDIQSLDIKTFKETFSYNISLIYQLQDCKIIYGNIKIPKKINIHRIDIRMKLDWSDLDSTQPDGKEIYSALRNTILVRLLLNKIIDNSKLKESLYEELGKKLVERLKEDKQSKEEKKYAIYYLKNLIKDTEKQLKGELWEKIEI